MPGPEPGHRPTGLQVLAALRLVADPAAIDAALADPPWPATALAARIAPDDLLVVLATAAAGSAEAAAGPATPDRSAAGPTGDAASGPAEAAAATAMVVTADDPFAIVEPESGFVGAWLDLAAADRWVAANAEWHLPHPDPEGGGPVLAQGMVAALPVKIVVDGGRALVMVPAGYAQELAERAGLDRSEVPGG